MIWDFLWYYHQVIDIMLWLIEQLILLTKGKLHTNAIIGGPDEPTFSDAEISELLEQENK